MNIDFIKTKSFWTGISLFAIAAAVASWWIETLLSRLMIWIAMMILYSINEKYKNGEWSKIPREKYITNILSSIEQFRGYNPEQRLRSNIFFYNKKKEKYYVKYHFNMEKHSDKNIEIPKNLGCTGEAWRTKNQIWGDKDQIFLSGPYKIAEEEYRKVSKDLQWICSTPIIDENKDVIAVMNFDGNQMVSDDQKKEVRKRCQEMAEELKGII